MRRCPDFRAFAQLLLDCLELFAQEELALGFAHGIVDLGLNLGAETQNLHLAVEQNRQQMQPFLKCREGQHCEFFRITDIDRIGDQIGDPDVVGQVDDRDLELLREIRRERNDLLKLFDRISHHCDCFDAVVRSKGEPAHFRKLDAVQEKAFHELHAIEPAQEHTHGAVRKFQDFDDTA